MSTQSDTAGVGRLTAVIRHKIKEGEFVRDGEYVLVAIAPYPSGYIKTLMGYSLKTCRSEGFRVIEVIDQHGRNQHLRIEVMGECAAA